MNIDLEMVALLITSVTAIIVALISNGKQKKETSERKLDIDEVNNRALQNKVEIDKDLETFKEFKRSHENDHNKLDKIIETMQEDNKALVALTERVATLFANDKRIETGISKISDKLDDLIKERKGE